MEIGCHHEFPPDHRQLGEIGERHGAAVTVLLPLVRRLRMDGGADLPRGRRDGTLLSGG